MPRTLKRLLIQLYQWLACADSPADADLIFAHAGRQIRKSYALEMFSRGRAPQLLLSVGRFEIRSFDDLPFPVRLNLPRMAASVSPPQRHLFVYLAHSMSAVEFIPKGRFGTLSEISALKIWLAARREIRSILIVSSPAHLRRVRLCCQNLLPASVQFRLLAVREERARLRPDLWWLTSKTRSIVLCELAKLVLYWLVLHFRSATRNVAPWFRSYSESTT